MGIDFPKTRTEADLGSGSLQIGDQWYADLNDTMYTVVAFNDANEAVWKGNATRRTGDPTFQEVLNEGNTANDSGNNVDEFILTKNTPNHKESFVQPGSIILTDNTSEIGPRVVFKNDGDDTYESRISVSGGTDSNGNTFEDRFVLDTNSPQGVWVFDQVDDGEGNLTQREFRIRPSDLEFARGVYSINNAALFGLPVDVEFGPGTSNPNDVDGNPLTKNYTVQDWSAVFNRALQNDPIGGLDVLTNGPIKTVTFPANVYSLLNPVIRTHPFTIVGEGLGITKFWMEEKVEDVEGEGNVTLWRMIPTEITADGSRHSGQFCLANKGNVLGVSFKGHTVKAGVDDTDNDDQYPDNDPDIIDDNNPIDSTWNYINYSAVLAFRKYDNNGFSFDTTDHLNGIELDENGVAGKQTDSADMDTKFINCGFGSKGKGGERNGCIKYLGRNGYFSNCTFNSNYTGLVLSFPNRPGHDVTTLRLGDNDPTDPLICNLNNSVANEMQGGTYGWRRMQILGCTFHMNKKARCIQMFGKYQCSGMVVDGCLSDIGGKFIDFNSTGPTGGEDGIENGDVYSNGVGGGLKNCVISNNSFGNQTAPNGSYITFADGRFDGNVITGNSFFGNDDSYKNSVCNQTDDPNYTTVKRCGYGIKIKEHVGVKGPISSGGRDTVVRGLVISNNNFSWFSNNAIDVDSENVDGLVITNNTFNNIGCPFIDLTDTPESQSAGREQATAVKVEFNTTCIVEGNMMIQETKGEPVDYGQNFFKTTTKTGSGGSTSPSSRSVQRVTNNTKLQLEPTAFPGTTT